MAKRTAQVNERLLAPVVTLHLLVVATLFGAMVAVGPLLPPILFHHLDLEPRVAALYMGVIFQRTTPLFACLAGGALVAEAVRISMGERPTWWVAALRYGATGLTLACLLLFLWHYIPAIQAYPHRPPEALASAAFRALHEGSRRCLSLALAATAAALALVVRP
ncbi:MAG: hypothetical protein COW73_06750 [Nitrospirae bacterium CG18_big_fil_WC_8_21_14_2_50_70_55]|nr:DUF4149 domain-containing protein [Deltaproteobacteria bacterium]OIP67896.1 MAG: hypothetical protein AUK30_00060 [Nitrospirae bacterium CG2_30_70_394]PIQ04995.1 MAG: hypothetical protein COW73_06750 [Nitrospirae bacterium CG18_big_fil_WC_8_21_14_2_50_70_55]PIU77930.1 MAG: hypothetical protein COS73_08670 [Nitrospirae bacterium CG06_land_8_20_14_3_00_70_43]PIW83962.1 MAG: hypothetical protein COZ96_00690 [Nitrospirae bacterium CG_4_8_14_3_um_filter_70_85]PIX84254.1 MAG: hypothetical protein